MNFREDRNIMEPLSMFSQSSLTDIILLLLIFFLLTSSFVTNFGIRVNVPRAESSVSSQDQQISVAVTPEGTFFVDGNQVDRLSLSDAIRSAYQEKPGASLVVRADRDARVDDAVRAMNIGKALNMNIIMATERN